MENNLERKAITENRQIKRPRRVHILVRVLVIGAALASTLITVTSKQDASLFGITFTAKYSYSKTFSILAYTNAVVAGLTFFILIYTCFAGRKGPAGLYPLFLSDLLLGVVSIAASSAAAAEGYIGKHGNAHTGWVAICPYVPSYCDRVMIAVVLSFASSLLLLGLTLFSATVAWDVSSD